MFYKIGHRGAAGYAPENTLLSFQKALELTVNMIELDVHICKSREVVVIHDKDTHRINNKKDLIKNQNYSDLKKLNILKLEDVLNLINRQVPVNIELKGDNTAEPVSEIIKNYITNNNWHINDFLISSFNKKELKKINHYLPEIKKGLLIGKKNCFFLLKKFPNLFFKRHLRFAKKIKAFSIHIHKDLINSEIVQITHANNFKIFTYTANSLEEITQFKDLGVDGIFSDYPDRL